MKIYIIGSWMMKEVADVWKKELIKEEHKVVAFFDEEIEEDNEVRQYNDVTIDWCDVVLLILPAGIASNFYAGMAVGKGKKLIIWSSGFKDTEHVYGFAYTRSDDPNLVLEALK